VSWDELLVVVTVAPVVAEVTRADNPALSRTPAEIAAEVAARAEASVCHLQCAGEGRLAEQPSGLFEDA
jgi:uncharacterized protein (DUF849 family)